MSGRWHWRKEGGILNLRSLRIKYGGCVSGVFWYVVTNVCDMTCVYVMSGGVKRVHMTFVSLVYSREHVVGTKTKVNTARQARHFNHGYSSHQHAQVASPGLLRLWNSWKLKIDKSISTAWWKWVSWRRRHRSSSDSSDCNINSQREENSISPRI